MLRTLLMAGHIKITIYTVDTNVAVYSSGFGKHPGRERKSVGVLWHGQGFPLLGSPRDDAGSAPGEAQAHPCFMP